MANPRKIVILGCTGSVGRNTVEVIRQRTDLFKICGLGCGHSSSKMKSLADEFSVSLMSVANEDVAVSLSSELGGSGTQVFVGDTGHRDLVAEAKPDVLIAAMSGVHGLRATLEAIRMNVPVLGIANKEVLVMAGPLILEALKKSKTTLVPVDSEHSAIFQCLMGNDRKSLKKIYLTASGGPFRTLPKSEFSKITKEQALKHPNWSMGAKITIDSASMMNKGLEYIEAIRLFDLKPQEIEILVHPQSIIHSMVEYCDHSIMAQLGVSDMKIPISLALSYPDRVSYDLSEAMDFKKFKRLDFEEVDLDRFPCLRLAIEAEASGELGPLILNAANEEAVRLFLGDQILFVQISQVVEQALASFEGREFANLNDMVDLDAEIRRKVREKWQTASGSDYAKVSSRKVAQ